MFCRDLHLDDVTDYSMLTPSFLVKRAADAIVFRDDAKETNYEYSWVIYFFGLSVVFFLKMKLIIYLLFYSYKTDKYEHAQKGVIVKGELSVVGAYTVQHPNGLVQTTMYVADKNGYRPQVQLRFSDLLKSAVG